MGVALASGSYSWGFSTVSEPLPTALAGAVSLAARSHSAGGHTPAIIATGLAGGHRSGALFSQSSQPPSPLQPHQWQAHDVTDYPHPKLSKFSSNLILS